MAENVADKKRKIVSEAQTAGLKRHCEEINRIVTESLQEALLALIEKNAYDSITITALCKKAGVSRMAFYGNFSSKDDILKSIITGLQKDLVLRIGSPFRKPVTEQWYVGLFRFVKEKASVLKLIFDAGFQVKYLELVNGILQRHKNMAAEEVYLRLFWCGGIVNAVIYWIAHGLKESPEEMAGICNKFLFSYNESTCVKGETFRG
ncbi:MAG: TetR/AcrR family transcriptional regulator [Candidatus Scatosoma sp.]